MTDHVAQNRTFWDGYSAEYQTQHAGHISPDRMAWGVWQIGEDEVRALKRLSGVRTGWSPRNCGVRP